MVMAAVGFGSAAIDKVKAQAAANAGNGDWTSLDFAGWSSASHEIARAAYNALPHVPACGVGKADGGTIDKAYVDGFEDKVDGQLSAAALRLSLILADALG
ncbi:MAG TPA: hypothetical protein VF475_16095 [Sphingobium sp.]